MGNGPLIWSICHLKMPLKFVTTKSLRTDKKTNLTKVQLNVICEMSLNVLSNSSYIRFHWEPGGACCVCKPIRSPCTSPHCSFPPNCHQRRDEQLIPDGTKCVIVTMCGTAFNLLEKTSINISDSSSCCWWFVSCGDGDVNISINNISGAVLLHSHIEEKGTEVIILNLWMYKHCFVWLDNIVRHNYS